MSAARISGGRQVAAPPTTGEQDLPVPFLYSHSRLTLRPRLDGGAAGTVVPTVAAIMPATAGEDIGCGIIAVKTSYSVSDVQGPRDALAGLRQRIESAAPPAADGVTEYLTESAAARANMLERAALEAGFEADEYGEDWRQQIGTVGGSEHAVALCADESGALWVTAHAGSRMVGRAIARRHLGIARALTDRYHGDLPNPALAYLVEGTTAFDDYLRQSHWSRLFAQANREELADRVGACVAGWIGSPHRAARLTAVRDEVTTVDRIDCEHNFIKLEQHLGQRIWVSCRGAINAHRGVRGIVPSATGSAMFVVEGEGNRSRLCRYPHGPVRPDGADSAAPGMSPSGDVEPTEPASAPAFATRWARHRAVDEEIRSFMTGAIGVVQLQHVLRPLLTVAGTPIAV